MRFCFSSSPILLLSLLAQLWSSFLMAADIGGTTYTGNTTLVDGDTWTTGNVSINDGALVNIPDLATVTFNVTLNSNLGSNTTGTLRIDLGGRFLHATTTGGDNLIVSGAVAILNNGTYEFASGGDLQLQHNGSTFTNNGLIRKTAGTLSGSNDPSYIFPNSTTNGGTFLNTGNITVDAGHLNIAGGSSTGGVFTTTAAGAKLSFSGKWTELTGVSSTFAGSSIVIGNEDPAATTGGFFTAAAATTILNVTGSGLGLDAVANINLNGNTLQNNGILILSTGTTTVQGLGSFENGTTGTFNLTGGTMTLNGGNLTNNGAMSNTGTVTLNGTASVINSSTGTFTLTSGTLNANTIFTNNGQFTLASGILNANAAVTNNDQMTMTGSVTIGGTTAVTNAVTGTFSMDAGTLTLSGNNFINNGIAEFSPIDGNVTISGTGRFINNAIYNHTYGGTNDNLVITGNATFENQGTFDLQNRGDIQIASAGVFENHGLVVKSVAGADPSYIYRDATGTGGTFTALAGSELRSNAGILHVSSGGTSDAAALWTADGGHLNIGGQWTGTITGSSANAGRVRITTSGNAGVASNLLIGVGGLTLDISGDGLFWDQATINTQGNTVTNVDTFTITGAITKTLSGAGEFLNASGATLTHLDGTVTFADGAILRNQGSMLIPLGASATGYAGTGSLINDTSGTINWSGGTFAVASPAAFHNQGAMSITGASTHTVSGNGIFSNDATGIVTWTDTSTVSIATGATFTNDGTFNIANSGNRLFSGTGQFVNNGTLNHNITDDAADNAGWSGTGQLINHGLFVFNDNGDYDMEGGHTVTNAATGVIRVDSTSNEEAQFFSFSANAGTGTFDNQGTVEVLAGKFRLTSAVSGSQFENTALTQNDAAGTLTGGTWRADSTATGTASIDLEPFGDTSGITTIGQNAVVDLTGANATLIQLSSLTQVDGSFYVNAKTFTPTGALTVGSTGTLGGNGTIAGSTSVNGAITPGSTQGDAIGKLTIGGDLDFNTGSEVTLQLNAPLGVQDSVYDPVVTRTLIDGLPDTDPTTEHDAIDVTGTLTLDPVMTIHVTNLGVTFSYGQYFDLFDWTVALAGISTQAEADAILDLPSLAGLQWDTSLFVSDGIIFVVPEPSRAVLFMMALGSLMLRRRRLFAGQR